MIDATTDVLVRVTGRIGRITLNRPRALNALTHVMVRVIDAALVEWAAEEHVIAVLIDGAGERGLCAGGDIRSLYDAAYAKNFEEPARFFTDEYRMNARIAEYPKPHIALMDGIVMGGGIGVSAHGNRRIVTDRAMLSMPEVGIGMIPDVGGTFLLGGAPDELGTHAALTAMRLTGADALVVGLADQMVASHSLPSLIEAIEAAGSVASIDAVLAAAMITPKVSALERARIWISKCYQGIDAEAVLAALEASPEPAAHEAASAIRRQSPIAVKVTLRALREARADHVLRSCLHREFRLAMRCMASHDFIEGVRAAVVDKDRNPRWRPARLEEVEPAMVDRYFAPFGDAGSELNLAD